MKKCFMSRSKEEILKMENFLKNELHCSVTRDNYIGYPMLLVPEDNYDEAIIKGTKYAIEHNIGCWWLDYDDSREYIKYVPLAFAEMAKKDLNHKGLWKLSTKLRLKLFEKRCVKALGRPIIIEKTHCNNVRFYLERTDDIEELHFYMRNKFKTIFIKSFCDTLFLPNAVLCDLFGKNIVQLKDMI